MLSEAKDPVDSTTVSRDSTGARPSVPSSWSEAKDLAVATLPRPVILSEAKDLFDSATGATAASEICCPIVYDFRSTEHRVGSGGPPPSDETNKITKRKSPCCSTGAKSGKQFRPAADWRQQRGMSTDAFWSRCKEWLATRESGDQRLRQRLIDDYRRAWQMGGRGDRCAVIAFVLAEQIESGFDLIEDGVRSEDAELALHAVANALVLATHGITFDPGMADALEDFGRRFSDARVLSDAALRHLGESAGND